jgi:ABC-type polysaccharide/polyol phosphate transport system ATPase subunit
MDSECVIVARNLHKTYIVHRRQATTLKEMVVKNLLAPTQAEPYLALRDVSFAVRRGEALAIVGGNGSGKSTLLKLISGLTEPTSGTVEVVGRVASLLELGAGFQEDFTGMENIFLQCAILGLSRAETLDRLGSILDFAEIGDFIHTPVKHYSSGMFVRLAFAIATNVDADVLLLDEVLAVGDQSFQSKCMDAIQEHRRRGRTILFVSHSIEHVRTVADVVLWLDKGEKVEIGECHDVLPHYFEHLQASASGEGTPESQGLSERDVLRGRFNRPEAKLLCARFLREDGSEARGFGVNEAFILEVDIEVMEALPSLCLLIQFGYGAVRGTWSDTGELMRDVQPGRYTLRQRVANHYLAPGVYFVGLALGDTREYRILYAMMLRLYALSLGIDERAAGGLNPPLLRPIGRWQTAE